MKAVRGSSKPANGNVRGKRPRNPGHSSRCQESEAKKLKENAHKMEMKRKERTSAPGMARAEDNWRPVNSASIEALEKLLDQEILTALCTRRTDKEETQRHLNTLKSRFLAQCMQLKVPFQRQRDFSHSNHQHREESKKSLSQKKTLGSLEKDLRALVMSLESTEKETVILENKCSKLRDQLKKEEQQAEELLQISKQGVLNLPPLPDHKDEESLQDRMMRLVPSTKSGDVAHQLGAILQKSAPIKNVQALLLQAHKYADGLLSPGSPPASAAL